MEGKTMNKSVVISLSVILTIFMSTSVLIGQTSTRAEFEEYCKAMEGRWVGDVTWIADWPGYGKKGDNVTCYWESRIIADGNALSEVYYGGNGMATGITYFDAGTKQIKGVSVSSGGTVWNWMLFKKEGKWQSHNTGSNPDGSKIEEKNTLTISNDGNTGTWTGTGTIGGEKMDPLHDVWQRASQ
jgi:hypothetical protein